VRARRMAPQDILVEAGGVRYLNRTFAAFPTKSIADPAEKPAKPPPRSRPAREPSN